MDYWGGGQRVYCPPQKLLGVGVGGQPPLPTPMEFENAQLSRAQNYFQTSGPGCNTSSFYFFLYIIIVVVVVFPLLLYLQCYLLLHWSGVIWDNEIKIKTVL